MIKDNPLISVIIPTYNRGQWIRRAVESVLNQSFGNFELIVVDDGSTDNTRQILSSFGDERIRIISQENQGVAAARNAGLSQAQGSYLALLDSDDIWLPKKLELQLSFMLDTGFMISQTEEIWIRHGQRVNPKFKHAKKCGWIFEPSLELCLVSPSCTMLTRKCWEIIGPFDQSLPACEDFDLWLRCSLSFPVGLLPKRLVYKYGGHPDQLSRSLIGLDLYRIYSISKLLGKADLTREQKHLAQKALIRKSSAYIRGCLIRQKSEEAQRITELVNSALKGQDFI